MIFWPGNFINLGLAAHWRHAHATRFWCSTEQHSTLSSPSRRAPRLRGLPAAARLPSWARRVVSDHFGTGWPELPHLGAGPTDGIKIDRLFAQWAGGRADAARAPGRRPQAVLGLATPSRGIATTEEAERALALGGGPRAGATRSAPQARDGGRRRWSRRGHLRCRTAPQQPADGSRIRRGRTPPPQPPASARAGGSPAPPRSPEPAASSARRPAPRPAPRRSARPRGHLRPSAAAAAWRALARRRGSDGRSSPRPLAGSASP